MVRDDSTGRAWGFANEEGVVVGPDPEGSNPKIVRVKMDRGQSIFEIKGIHMTHLKKLSKSKRG
jgi:hypothetical protein